MRHRPTVMLRNSLRLALGVSMVGLGVFGPALAAWAGDVNSKVTLDIPPQNLGLALASLAQQADLQILFSAELVAGMRSAALSGSYSGVEALQRLLAQSNLEFVVDGPDTIVIRNPAETSSSVKDAPAPGSSAAAAESPQSSPSSLEEVIVTAQKRAERLQDVPLAVTALSGDMLADAGINDTGSLVSMTPSLTYTQGANVVNTNFRVRGIGTAVFGPGLEPSVSVVVDGVVLARAGQGFADLADIQRVEILRGPQGTLFGKNAVGGLINVVTKPASKTFEADADVTVAEDDEYRVRGSVSGPLSDSLGARLTGYYNDVGGHVRNLTLDRDVNGYESMGFRGKLDWETTENLDLRLVADYRKTDADCCSSVYVQVDNPLLQQLLAPVTASFNNRLEVENALTYNNTEQTLLSIEGNLDFGGATLTSLTAYQDFSFENNQPVDRLNTPVPLYLPVTNGWFDINGAMWDITQVTQEFRLTSAGDGRLNYAAGLYLLDMDLDFGFIRRSGGCAPGGEPAAFGQPCITPLYRSQAGMRSNTQTQNAALFGQLDFRLTDRLSALAGGRLQYEEVSYEGSRPDARLVAGDLPLLGITVSSGSGETNDTELTGKLGLKYEFSDAAQTYLTWSTGYKGAGYHTGFEANFDNQEPIEPETARAWELGSNRSCSMARWC